jgi:AcrR family transcriptional regulator
MHEARAQAIVAAAGRLLGEKGFEAMTLDEVAAEVGVAKASLYKHFAGKEDLCATAMARAVERLLDGVAVVSQAIALCRDDDRIGLGRRGGKHRCALRPPLPGCRQCRRHEQASQNATHHRTSGLRHSRLASPRPDSRHLRPRS